MSLPRNSFLTLISRHGRFEPNEGHSILEFTKGEMDAAKEICELMKWKTNSTCHVNKCKKKHQCILSQRV